MSTDISFERLIEYAAGKLSPMEAGMVEAYLASSPSAAATVSRFREVAHSIRSDDSVLPPARVLDAAKELYRENPPKVVSTVAEWMRGLQRALATLIYDSRPQVALAGFRGHSDRYQVSFQAADVEIDLDVECGATGTQRQVMGQISGVSQLRPDSIGLSKPGTLELIASATPDAVGMFKVVAESGTFDLLIGLEDRVVVVANLEL